MLETNGDITVIGVNSDNKYRLMCVMEMSAVCDLTPFTCIEIQLNFPALCTVICSQMLAL